MPKEIYYIVSSTLATLILLAAGIVLMNFGCSNYIGSHCSSNCTTDGYTITEGVCSNNVSCFSLEDLCNTTLLHMSSICKNVTANDIIVFDGSDCDNGGTLAKSRMAIIGFILLIIGVLFMFGSSIREIYLLRKRRPSYEPINYNSYTYYGSI